MPVPVVLVHGFGSHFEYDWRRSGWVDILEAEGRTVRGVDLPGHGTADRTNGHTAAEAVHAAASGGPVDAVGFSAGGHAVLAAAAERPGAFRRLALLGVGSLHSKDGRERASTLAAALESDREPEDLVGARIRKLVERSGNDRRELAALLRSGRRRVAPDEVRRLEMPVLLVVGDRDFSGSGEELERLLPNAERVVLPGADHFATINDVRCIEAVVDFLAR